MAGGDLLQDVIHADALAPGQVPAHPAMQRLGARQIGTVGQRGGHPPGDQLRGLAVLPHHALAGQDLALPGGAQQRGHAGRGSGDARLDQVSALPGLIPVQRLLAGPRRLQACQRRAAPDEAALALLGLDPPVLAQHPQRPHHGRPGDLELIAELMLTGQQRPRRVLAGLDPPPQLIDHLGVLRRSVLIRHGMCLTQVA